MRRLESFIVLNDDWVGQENLNPAYKPVAIGVTGLIRSKGLVFKKTGDYALSVFRDDDSMSIINCYNWSFENSVTVHYETNDGPTFKTFQGLVGKKVYIKVMFPYIYVMEGKSILDTFKVQQYTYKYTWPIIPFECPHCGRMVIAHYHDSKSKDCACLTCLKKTWIQFEADVKRTDPKYLHAGKRHATFQGQWPF